MPETETIHAPDADSPPQETTIIHTAEPGSSQSNANLMMAMVMLMILLIGVAVAFALKNNSDPEKVEKERLTRQLAAINEDVTGALALEGRVAAINDNANQILVDFSSMKDGYQSAKDELKRTKSELEGNMSTITRISSSLENARKENAQLKNLAGSANAYKQQLTSLREELAEKDRMMAELQTRPSQESLNNLRTNLNTIQMNKDELAREIQTLKQRMITMVDKADSDQLRQKLPILEKENTELKNTIQTLRTELDFGALFVKSKDLLPAKAKLLYTELDILEGVTTPQLVAAYAKIQATLNAENLHQVRFAEGSSLLSFTDQAAVRTKIAGTGNSDYFLVVGYASTTGDADSNKKLSANRATAVASVVNQLKKQGQEVRAVYLGQTDRFSADKVEDNQLCEIWRMKE